VNWCDLVLKVLKYFIVFLYLYVILLIFLHIKNIVININIFIFYIFKKKIIYKKLLIKLIIEIQISFKYL
jgi:hypothetical protein